MRDLDSVSISVVLIRLFLSSDRSAASFENSDCVAKNYRWRQGLEGETNTTIWKSDYQKSYHRVSTITMEDDANGAPHLEPTSCSQARKLRKLSPKLS